MIKVWKTGRERDRDREKPGKWGSTPGAPLRCFAIDETPAPATPVKWPLFDLTTPETSPFLPSQSARPHMYTLTHPHTHTHTHTHPHTHKLPALPSLRWLRPTPPNKRRSHMPILRRNQSGKENGCKLNHGDDFT